MDYYSCPRRVDLGGLHLFLGAPLPTCMQAVCDSIETARVETHATTRFASASLAVAGVLAEDGAAC